MTTPVSSLCLCVKVDMININVVRHFCRCRFRHFYLRFIKLHNLDRVRRIWYLSPMRAVKVQASLRIRAVSPESSLLAHTSSESRGTFRQKARSLAPLNVWACAVKICHDGMLEDTNSLDGAHISFNKDGFTRKRIHNTCSCLA